MTAFIAPFISVSRSRPLARCRARTRSTGMSSLSMRLPACETLRRTTLDWGVNVDPGDEHGSSITALSTFPPLLRIEFFLSDEECDAIITAQESKTTEADLYLNYRVNQEVESGISQEAEELISSSGVSGISASNKSGFRAQVSSDEPSLQTVLEKIRVLLGFGSRKFVFEEGAWIRPNKRTILVRDQTTVRYEIGEGVAPHVDGKDVTILICLEEPVSGGRTVFPDEGLAVVPKKGCALVYRSCGELVHFAEAVTKGRKWVLQLLVDFKVRTDEMDLDFRSGVAY